MWVTYPRTGAEAIQMVRELGAVTDTARRAGEIAGELDALYAATRATVTRRATVPVFYPIWREPYMTIGRDTYVHDMLGVCGGANVFADRPARYPTVTLDELVARRPAVILLPDEPFRFRQSHVADCAACQARVHLVDGKPFSWHGPRIAEALRSIPGLLAPIS